MLQNTHKSVICFTLRANCACSGKSSASQEVIIHYQRQEDFVKQIQSVKRGTDSIVITHSVPGLSLSSFPRKSRQEKCHKKHVHRSITEFWMLLVAVCGNSYHDKNVSSFEQYVDSINCRIAMTTTQRNVIILKRLFLLLRPVTQLLEVTSTNSFKCRHDSFTQKDYSSFAS